MATSIEEENTNTAQDFTVATSVKSADRALEILEHLSRSPGARSLAEIADALRIPRSSLHGLLRTMERRGWLLVEGSDAGVRYRIGGQALSVGTSYLAGDDIVRQSENVLNDLSADLGETIHLGVLEGGDVIYLAKRDAHHSLRLVSGVGVRLPAYATALGKILVAGLSSEAQEEFLKRPRRQLTRHTLVRREDLVRDLDASSTRGYGIDNQESTEGVRCFAVALGGRQSRALSHAISCSVPLVRLDDGRQNRIIERLREGVRQFSLSYN